MASSLGSMTVDLNADIAKFTAAMTKAELQAKQFADKAERYVVGAAVAIGGAFTIASIKGFIDDTIRATAKLDDFAEISGTTVERLSSWGGVAKIAGTSLDEVTTAVAKMSKGLLAADEETKGAGAALAYLGIEAKDTMGNLRDPGAVLDEVAKKLSEFKDGAGKTAWAMDLLGRSGAQMLPFLKKLAEEGELQVKVTAQQAAQAEHYEDTLKRLESQKKAVAKVIVMEMIPAMDELAALMLKNVSGADGLRKAAGDLARDGSIADWSESGAISIAKMYDVVKDTVTYMSQVPHSIAVIVKDVMTLGEVIAKSGGNALTAYLNREEIAKVIAERNAFVAEANEDLFRRMVPSNLAARLTEQFAQRRNALAGMAAGADIGGGPRKDFNYSRAQKPAGEDPEMRQYLAALQRYELELGKVNQMSEAEKAIYETTEGSLRKLTDAHKADILAVAGEVDERRAYIKVIEATYAAVRQLAEEQERNWEVRGGFAQAAVAEAQQAEFQLSLIGKTAVQIQNLTIARNEELRALAAKRQLVGEDVQAGRDAIDKRAAAHTELMQGIAARERALSREWQTGMANGLNAYIDMVDNAAAQTESLIANAFRGMEDALTNFVMHGKLDFKSLADSIISELIRIEIRQSITEPIAKAMKESGGLVGLLGSVWGGGKGGDTPAPQNISVSDYGLMGFAGGGDPPVGRPAIVGENGPELFIPKAAGSIIPNGAFGGGVQVNVINNGPPVSAQAQPPRMDGRRMIVDVIVSEMRTNGGLRDAMRASMSAPA